MLAGRVLVEKECLVDSDIGDARVTVMPCLMMDLE